MREYTDCDLGAKGWFYVYTKGGVSERNALDNRHRGIIDTFRGRDPYCRDCRIVAR